MLKLAGILNIIIGLGHLGVLPWLDQVFRMFGIAEGMNRLSDINPLLPVVVTVITALLFIVAGLYGLSAAGSIGKLPLLKLGVYTIATIFTLRGIAGFVSLFAISPEYIQTEALSSLTALIVGLMYLLGGLRRWRNPKAA